MPDPLAEVLLDAAHAAELGTDPQGPPRPRPTPPPAPPARDGGDGGERESLPGEVDPAERRPGRDGSAGRGAGLVA